MFRFFLSFIFVTLLSVVARAQGLEPAEPSLPQWAVDLAMAAIGLIASLPMGETILGVIAFLIPAALVIMNTTFKPGPESPSWLRVIYRVLEIASGILTKRASSKTKAES